MGRIVWLAFLFMYYPLFIIRAEWRPVYLNVNKTISHIVGDDSSGIIYLSAGEYIYGYSNSAIKKCLRLRGRNPISNQLLSMGKQIYVAAMNGLFIGECGSRLKRLISPKGNAVYCMEKRGSDLFLGTAGGCLLFKTVQHSVHSILSTKSRVIAIKYINSKGLLFVLTDNKLIVFNLLHRKIIFSKIVKLAEREKEWEAVAHLFAIVRNTLFFAYENHLYAMTLDNNLEIDRTVTLPGYIKAITAYKEWILVVLENRVYKYSVDKAQLSDFSDGISGSLVDIVKINKNIILSGSKEIYVLSCLEDVGFSNADIGDIYAYLSFEPDILLLQKEAMKYADVLPEKIKNWKYALKRRAIAPEISIEMGGDNNKSVSDSLSVCCSGSYAVGPDDKTVTKNLDWKMTLQWDLRDLIWDPEATSIDARSKLTTELRDDILDDLDQLYYERRREQIRLLTDPPNNLDDAIKRLSKLEKLRADIDGMTNGFLSNFLRNNRHYDWELEFIRRHLNGK